MYKNWQKKVSEMLPGEARLMIQKVDIVAHSFEAVSEFKYIVSTFNNENKISNEINKRIISWQKGILNILAAIKVNGAIKKSEVKLQKNYWGLLHTC